jgi:excisionase family DNA binding protein
MAMAVESFSPREVAREAQVGLMYLYSLLQTGQIPAVKVDGQWRIAPDVAAAFVERRRCRLRQRSAKQAGKQRCRA